MASPQTLTCSAISLTVTGDLVDASGHVVYSIVRSGGSLGALCTGPRCFELYRCDENGVDRIKVGTYKPSTVISKSIVQMSEQEVPGAHFLDTSNMGRKSTFVDAAGLPLTWTRRSRTRDTYQLSTLNEKTAELKHLATYTRPRGYWRRRQPATVELYLKQPWSVVDRVVLSALMMQVRDHQRRHAKVAMAGGAATGGC